MGAMAYLEDFLGSRYHLRLKSFRGDMPIIFVLSRPPLYDRIATSEYFTEFYVSRRDTPVRKMLVLENL
jgi:hypothetical protein